MRKGFVFILAVFAAALLVQPAAAETPAVVDAVEVTGSRLAEDIGDVPASTYVVTKEQIAISGAGSTQELLARIPGVTGLVNGASMAQAKGITVRGLNTEVLLLVDGVPVMGAHYGVGAALGSPFDLREITPGSIERIEVVKGASSALYGSNAAGGVINIITKKGGEKDSASILLEGDSNGWRRGSVRGTAVLSNDVRVTVGYTRTQEDDVKIRLLPNGTYDKATDFRGNNYLFRVDKDAWTFSAELGDYDSKWDHYDSWTSATEKNGQENDYRRFLLGYNDGKTAARIYYNMSERTTRDVAGLTDFSDRSIGASFSRKQDIFGLRAVWGLDWRQEKAEYENINPSGSNLPYDLTRNGFAPFLEFSVPLGELALDIGLRYEHWDVDDADNVNEFVPKFSLNWGNPDGGLWYLTAGRFFSMPSFFQMFYRDSWGFSLSNPDLEPEKGWSYDLGFKNLKAKNPWTIGIFYMHADDKINYNYNTATWQGRYENMDKYRAWGAEAEITFNFNENWSYTQGLSWIKAEEKKEDGDKWTRSGMPRWDVLGRLNYINGPWSGEIAFNWLLDREIPNNTFGNYSDRNIFLVDIAAAWQMGNDRIKISCLNLFDKEYVLDSQGYITPERRFVISYERTF